MKLSFGLGANQFYGQFPLNGYPKFFSEFLYHDYSIKLHVGTLCNVSINGQNYDVVESFPLNGYPKFLSEFLYHGFNT